MSRSHLSMRKIREILRLRLDCKCSYQEITNSINISCSTASECIRRAKAVNLSWPLLTELTDEQCPVSKSA